jgi:hypothetical protein
MHSLQNLLREPDVTREYPFSAPWLRKRRRLHLPPAFVRIGRMVFYERSELDAFVKLHRVEANVHRERSETARLARPEVRG